MVKKVIMSDEGLHIINTVDNSQLYSELSRGQNAIRKSADSAVKEGDRIDATFGKVATTLGGLATAFSMSAFVKQMVQTRGEFQQIEVSFNTMLGSAEKANALMQQLTKTAAVTPFDLKGVADGAKQLLAYGTAANDVNDTLVHLGDIAAGLSLPLGDLVYLYGTTMTQGRMYTMDLRQFMGRGIPIAEELAKQFGVTKDKVGALVTEGKVGAKEFNAAIMSMSSEGGKFGGLMEAQSKTISGRISNIEDAFSVMLNNMGKNSEGIINGSLSAVSSLIENYEQVGRVIASVVAVFGVYKAALITQAAGIEALTVAEAAHYGVITLVEKAQKLLNATMLANPYVLVAVGIAGVVAAFVSMKTAEEQVADATKNYNDAKQKTIEKEEQHRAEVEKLMSVAKDESLSTETRRDALVRLEQQYPAIFAKYKTEADMLAHILEINNAVIKSDNARSITVANNELKHVNLRIKQLEEKGKKLRVGIGSNKYGMITPFLQGRTSEEEAELKSLRKKKSELSKGVGRSNADSYLANLTGVSNKDLDKQIKERKSLIAEINISSSEDEYGVKHGKRYGKTQVGGATGIYNKDELQGQLQDLQREKNRRNEKKYTPAQRKAQLKKSLDSADKALKDFDKSSNKYSADEVDKKRKELQEAASSAEKAYKGIGGSTAKSGGKVKNTPKQIAAEKEREAKDYRDKLEVMNEETEKLQSKLSQSEISTLQDGRERELRQMKQDNEAELEQLDDEKREYIKKKEETAKAKAKANGKKYDSKDGKLTKGEEDKFSEIRENTIQRQMNDYNALMDVEKSDMRSFLQEYGTMEQKKLAITEDYEERIRKAKTDGEKASLTMQRDSSIEKAESEEMTSTIDWDGVFSDLKGHTTGYLEGLRAQLQSMVDKGDLPVDQMQTISSKIHDIDDALGKQQTLWNFIGDKAREHKRLIGEAADSQSQLNEAKKNEADYANEILSIESKIGSLLSTAGISVDKVDAKSLSELDKGSDSFQKIASLVNPLILSLAVAEGKLAKARKETKKATEDAESAEDKSKVSTSQSVANWFSDADQFIAEKGIDQIPQLLDDFGMGDTGKRVASGLSAFNSASGAVADYASGNYIGAAVKSIDAIKSFSDAIIGGGNVDSMEAEIAKLGESNENLAKAVSDLSENIGKSDSTSQQSIDAYKAAIDAESEWEENQRQRIDDRASEHGRHHSFDYNVGRKGTDWSGWDEFNQVLAANNYTERVSSADDLWSLSPEMMKLLRDYAPSAWNELLNETAGQSNPSGLIDEYIERAGKIEELTDALNEKLTGYSWDGFLDSYKNLLKNCTSRTVDFADNINEIISNALLESLTNDEFATRIKALYAYIAEHADDGLDTDEVDYIRSENESIAQAMLKRRQQLEDAGLVVSSSTQSASSKGYQTISQDTGEEISGRETAILIGVSDIQGKVSAGADTLNRIEVGQGAIVTRIDAMQTAMATSNIYLANIAKYSKKMLDFGDKLDEIIKNTKNI